MLFRSGKNWVVDFFVSRGWLVKHPRLRRRVNNWQVPSSVAAECLEDRTLLSTITITSLADSLNAGNGVTLRDAIQAANTDASVDGSVAGQAGVQNVIDFTPGLTGTIALGAGLGQMTISSSMTIEGLGAANTVIDAKHNSRIFYITTAAADVTIESIALDNGKTIDNGFHSASNPGAGEGGAIRSAATGTLTVINSTLSGNSTSGVNAYGGAIYSNGPLTVTSCVLTGNSTAGTDSFGGAITAVGLLTVTNSTLSGNSTTGTSGLGGAIKGHGAISVANSTLSGNSTSGYFAYGGAIASYAALTVTNSTLSGNSTTAARGAGGAIRCNGPLTVTNSTLSGNSTAGTNAYGGAIAAIGTTTVTNSTIVQNRASGATAGGIYHDLVNGTAITLRNTILAQNADNGTAPDSNVSPVTNTVTVQNSLIGDNKGTSLTAAPVGSPDANGNLIGTVAAPINALLGPLANNGGPTQTMGLLAGSPAINAGSNALAIDPSTNNLLTTDQRGGPFVRIYGAAVDMGAFESQTVSLVVSTPDDTLDAAYNPAHVTLRDAVAAANINPGPATIAFAAAINGIPIDLVLGPKQAYLIRNSAA